MDNNEPAQNEDQAQAQNNIDPEENLLQSEPVLIDKVEAVPKPTEQQVPAMQNFAAESLAEVEPSTYVFFKSSQLPVDPKIKEFLQKQMEGSPFNKYCIDCKKKKTSHFLVQYGLFICQDCANIHNQMNFYQFSRLQIKHVYFEHWDDYQLKSVQVGGNRPLFDLLKEYDISDLEIPHKYRHAALRWYRRRHLANLDGWGMSFTEPKPAKNMDERINNTKAMFKKEIDNLNPKIQQIEEGSVDFSLKVDKKLQEIGTKIATSKFGQSFSKKFNKITKRDTNNRRPSMDEPNTEAFSGDGTTLGSSTGETDPIFDEQNMTNQRQQRSESVQVHPVYDEPMEGQKKQEDQQ